MNLNEQYIKAKYRFQRNSLRNMDSLKEAFEKLQNKPADNYGKGEIIEEFEKKIANILGKEAAVFMPSGTMAQQIALRIYADEKKCKKIAYHPLSHLEIHENDSIRVVHNLEPIILGDKDRLFTLQDLMDIKEQISSLLIELPQRELGGVLPSFEDLKSIVNYAREKEIYVHLDGARLFESCPFYKKSPKEISELFDSVYVSFYKGIGSIAGAILAGKKEMIEKSKIWKRRLGGDLISLYPYIIPADYYYEKRKDKMEEFYLNAKKLAKYFNDLPKVSTKPEIPMSNMFHVYVEKNKDELENIMFKIFSEFNLSMSNHIVKIDDKVSKFEISIGEEFSKIPEDLLKKVFLSLKQNM